MIVRTFVFSLVLLIGACTAGQLRSTRDVVDTGTDITDIIEPRTKPIGDKIDDGMQGGTDAIGHMEDDEELDFDSWIQYFLGVLTGVGGAVAQQKFKSIKIQKKEA